MASASDDSSIPTPLTSFGMSREASLAGTSFCGGFDLMRVDSQTSDAQSFHDMHQEDRIHEPALTTYSKDGRLVTVPTSNLSLSVSYAGGMADSATWPSIQPAAEASQPSYGFENGLDMARSKSSDCRSSPSSRIVRRSQEQVVQAERPIAPKERSKGSEPTQPLLKSASEHGMIRQRSADGKKVSIPRVDHVRPKQPGLKCNLCNKKPDGYKGPHELRRHKETAHDKLSAYVCVDLSSDQKWLSECRACQSRHQYPQKHNAAAHLRRMHWHPKSKDRRTGVKSGESRGGKGGGREPPMAELQRWIQKISLPETGHESADKNINDDGDDDDDDESAAESDGDEDEIFVLDDIQASSSQTLDNGPSGPGANAALDNDSALSIDIDQNQNLALLGFWPHYDYFPQPTFDNNFDQYAGPPLYSSAPTIPHDTNADSMNSPPVDQTLATGTLGFNGLPFMPSMNSAFDRLSHFNALDPS